LLGKLQQSLAVRPIARTSGGSFYQSRAFERFASKIGNPRFKFLCELRLPTAKNVCPCFDCVFVNVLIVQSANAAPAIVIDEIHRRFPPRPFPKNTPLQNRSYDVVPVPENVRFHNQVLANDALYGVAAAVDQRLQILDHNGRKSPSHGPSINRDSRRAKEQINQSQRPLTGI
jgi:hypothetical protein